ncbi:CenpB-DNA-bind-domain-containing protein [Lentinus tigrinus ALCF2SS1-6]|uniref:CenpB-DNA-bind-domain-containing protein n=1 Tax=Lentinus tigrinus ALCF2SS1-6 TaxID=1328759 RepID=A0A5C2SHL1_9APHY|nr:CenpB-DNA-bind-domain-containing protein [Lentinus tigrinus ALCF2SS1-6]
MSPYPGPSSHTLSFESHQIDSSIGPDRGLPRRRLRIPERVQSHGELPEYATMSNPYNHPQNSPFIPHPQHGSRPQTPTHQPVYQLSETPGQPSMSTPDAYHHRMDSISRVPEWRGFFPPQSSRSASGSTTSGTSANSNPRSASPALSVASALTSVSSASAPNSLAATSFVVQGAPRREPTKKKRLWNTDRRDICKYAEANPGVKQEDIAAHFGVERSTVSKILKQKARWLSVDSDEKVLVAKLRPSKFPSLERRLEEWVKLASKSGKTLTDSVLRQKAREFGDEMGYTADKFKASSGWLENFKHRHGIRRGVWHGDGLLDAKYRAYATDFIPTMPEPYVPPPPGFVHPPSPAPIDMPSHVDQDMGIESEDEEQPQGGGMSTNAQVVHPSITLSQAWPQAEEQPNAHDVSEERYSPERPHQLEYPPQEPAPEEPEASQHPAMMPVAPVAVPLDGDESSGQQVYVTPVMPEFVPEHGMPTLQEAEHALDKFILYVAQDEKLLGIEEVNFLMRLKHKVFGKVAGVEYDLPYGRVPSKS